MLCDLIHVPMSLVMVGGVGVQVRLVSGSVPEIHRGVVTPARVARAPTPVSVSSRVWGEREAANRIRKVRSASAKGHPIY